MEMTGQMGVGVGPRCLQQTWMKPHSCLTRVLFARLPFTCMLKTWQRWWWEQQQSHQSKLLLAAIYQNWISLGLACIGFACKHGFGQQIWLESQSKNLGARLHGCKPFAQPSGGHLHGLRGWLSSYVSQHLSPGLMGCGWAPCSLSKAQTLSAPETASIRGILLSVISVASWEGQAHCTWQRRWGKKPVWDLWASLAVQRGEPGTCTGAG